MSNLPFLTLYVARKSTDLNDIVPVYFRGRSTCINNCRRNKFIDEQVTNTDPKTQITSHPKLEGPVTKIKIAPLTRVVLFESNELEEKDSELKGKNYVIDNTSKSDYYKEFKPPIKIGAIIISESNNAPNIIEPFDFADYGISEQSNFNKVILFLIIVIVLYIIYCYYKSNMAN